MYEPYYTSRCVDNVLYVISSGNLRKEDDEIVVGYNEDNMEKEMSIDKIKYLKDVKTTKQTLISTVDLNNETADIKLDSYLMNISNAYVSENAIYLLNQKYNNDSKIPIKLLFGFKGVFGLEDYYEMDSESGYYTEIYKFDIKENVEYKAKTKVKGKTINQYSLDEKDNHLRIALHPYDENHIIGIGMETKEIINRNSNGKVISTTAKVVGMKMALFDVSNVNSPVQISSVVIGDSRTTSAILTNPKALLFSKEKSLIAIPVNNYSQDFEVTSSNNYETMINNYTKYGKPYNAEGYFVYNINVQDGFKLKGVITHEKTNATYYYSNSKLLRGLYIDNNLYTVSETMIKVNELDSLKAVGELKLKNTENVDSSVREQSNNVINAIEGGM